MKFLKTALAVIFTIFILYLLFGELALKPDNLNADDWCEEYDGEWVRYYAPDGIKETVTIPGKLEVERGEDVQLITRLPEVIPAGTYLCFRSAKQDMKFYIDGELRKEYSTKESRIFGNASAVAYVFVQLRPEDAGKLLYCSFVTDSSYAGIFYGVLIGTQMGIWQEHFQLYGLELLVAIVTILFGVLSIIIGLVMGIAYKQEMQLEYLGWGIIIAAIWLIFNSAFRQLMFENVAVINDMAFLMLMILPLPFIIYMNSLQKGRYEKVYIGLGIMVLVDILVCCMLHVSGFRDFTDTIVVMVAVCVIAILAMAFLIFVDLKRGNCKEYLLVVIGLICAFAAAVIQIIIYFNRTITFTGSIMALGLVTLLIFATANAFRELIKGEQEKKKAIYSSEAKGRFLANMSHEIRTPINAVLGMNAMILRESNEAEIRGYALKVQNAGEGLLSIVNDVLDISKIESGKMEIVPVKYDLSGLLYDVVNIIQIKAQKKNLKFHIKVDENLPGTLYGDDIRIKQVLINLLNNAVKYTPEGAVSLELSGIREADEMNLEFHVRDTGVGIKEEDIGKLFAEFERIEEVRNRGEEGTGLGMSITMQLLTLMDSKLEVQSVYGEGSDFFFHIKQKVLKDAPIGNFEEEIVKNATEYSYQVAFKAPKAQILVVDDNFINREVFMKLLKDTEMQIEEAESGEVCLQMMKKKHYDMVFLDHMMPGMSGLEVMREIRKLKEDGSFPCQNTLVVALTANVIAGMKEQYLEEGFHYYLTKPIRYDELELLLATDLPEELVHKMETGKQERKNKTVQSDEEELPVVEGIDWDYALMKLHRKDILKDTVIQFIHTGKREAQSLEEMYMGISAAKEDTASDDISAFQIKVHSMKSAALMIGAIAVGGMALSLELSARREDREEIFALTPSFLKRWRDLVETLKELFEPEETNGFRKEIDLDELKRLSEQLKSAMNDMDVDVADAIVLQLKEFDFTGQSKEILEELADAVMNLDEENACLNCDRLVQHLSSDNF